MSLAFASRRRRGTFPGALTGAVGAALLVLTGCARPGAVAPGQPHTPIQHVVVIFQENRSFDNYFGTYPNAANKPGETPFVPLPNTPAVNGLTPALLEQNPNAKQPLRLDQNQVATCDMIHAYRAEQEAVDGGKMDRFVQSTTGKDCHGVSPMDYYDGNTVTGLWNYAQHYSMSDNFFAATYGESTPGALNLIAGQTHGASPPEMKGAIANGTVIGDADPAYDDCSGGDTFSMSGRNIGDLLNTRGVTWGWFQAGFRPTGRKGDKAVCDASSKNLSGDSMPDYSPHHEPFQYYKSTANPHHLPPSAPSSIGKSDQANHQYDLADFWVAAQAGSLPAVSFLKASVAQDGHPQSSSPLDEQVFLVNTINRLMKLPEWSSMAIFVTWDDSDGWYDHVYGQQSSPSNDPSHDVRCGVPQPSAYLDRCGLGPRLPLLVISPYVRANYVDHQLASVPSIPRFIEDNWDLGRLGDQSFDVQAGSLNGFFDFPAGPKTPTLFLNPTTGQVVQSAAKEE